MPRADSVDADHTLPRPLLGTVNQRNTIELYVTVTLLARFEAMRQRFPLTRRSSMMSTIRITGITANTFFTRTQAALGPINGSPVTKKHKVTRFLQDQLGLSSENTLSVVFDTPPAPISRDTAATVATVSNDTISELFSAIQGATLTLEDEIDVCHSLLRGLLTKLSPSELKNSLTSHLDPFEDDVDEDDKVFSESNAVANFVRALPADKPTCKRCGSDLIGRFCETDQCPYHDYEQTVPLDSYYTERPDETLIRKPIFMTLESDDMEAAAELDVSAYFYHALDHGTLAEELIILNGEDFQAGGATDTVAQWMREFDSEAERVLSYCEALLENDIEACGFQASIDKDEVRQFLRTVAPTLASAIT
jgi:hypothetical protein